MSINKKKIKNALQGFEQRQAERTKKKKIQNERCLRYAAQERQLKKGSFEGPEPVRKQFRPELRIEE